MASYSFYGLGLVWLCVLLLGDGVRGRGLRGVEKEINGSIQSEGYHKGGFIVEKLKPKGLKLNGSLSNFQSADIRANRVQHWALARQEDGEYYGIKATLNVYGLSGVLANQTSSVLIRLTNGVGTDNENAIQAGWHVHPALYGDFDTYFFVYWTADNYQNTGCHNLDCGFVPEKSSKYVPGTKLRPLSTYKGEQRFLHLKISKNPQTGDWWLHAGPNEEPVGHWPKSLFTSLADSASMIDIGGAVNYHKTDKGPPMGNGHFPGEGDAAFIKDIQLVLKNGEDYRPSLDFVVDRPDCYSMNWNYYLGGPAGCTE